MLAGLVLSASIPKAFEGARCRSRWPMRWGTGRNLFMLWALKNHDVGNFRNFVRIIAWQAAVALLWIAGPRTVKTGAVDGRSRHRSRRAFPATGCGDRPLGHHRLGGRRQPHGRALLAVRHRAWESVLTGATFAALSGPPSYQRLPRRLRGQRRDVGDLLQHRRRAVRRLIARQRSRTPGAEQLRICAILIVAGIIVAAVGDDLALHHLAVTTRPSTIAVLIGRRRSISSATCCSSACPHPNYRGRIWWGLDCWRS
jgi:hypothetical protein